MFPDAGGVVELVVLDVVVCAVPPLVEPVLGVDEVVVDALLLVVVAAELAVVLDVVTVVVVDPVDPVEPAVPLVPVGPRLSSGLVIVGVSVGRARRHVVGDLRAAAGGEREAAQRHGPDERAASFAAAAAFDGRTSGSR